MLRPGFEAEGGQPDPAQSNNFFAPGQPGDSLHQQQQQFGMPLLNTGIAPTHPGATGRRYYTIQRVNGNGGNGKGDGVAGPHKHTLAESDRVKKNSVQRYLMKENKEKKKSQVSCCSAFHIAVVSELGLPVAPSEQGGGEDLPASSPRLVGPEVGRNRHFYLLDFNGISGKVKKDYIMDL